MRNIYIFFAESAEAADIGRKILTEHFIRNSFRSAENITRSIPSISRNVLRFLRHRSIVFAVSKPRSFAIPGHFSGEILPFCSENPGPFSLGDHDTRLIQLLSVPRYRTLRLQAPSENLLRMIDAPAFHLEKLYLH